MFALLWREHLEDALARLQVRLEHLLVQRRHRLVAAAVILIVLLAAPFLARVLVGGTAAVLIVAFPAAATLSASGARYDRAYGPASLLAILAIAWIIGVAIMGIRAARKRSAA